MNRTARILVLSLIAGCGIGLLAPSANHQASAQDSGTSKPSASSSEADSKASSETKVQKTDEEWRTILTRSQFLVTRLKATEAPFSGVYSRSHSRGTFVCVCCGAELFSSKTKFESGTGWPSFWQPIRKEAVATQWDYSEAEPRLEVTCRRCDAHLGHVFDDGPAPTGLRYCINSLSLKLRPAATATTSKTSAKSKGKAKSKTP